MCLVTDPNVILPGNETKYNVNSPVLHCHYLYQVTKQQTN